jgi:hypothetical protein
MLSFTKSTGNMLTILTTINSMSCRNGLAFGYPADVSHLRPHCHDIPLIQIITNLVLFRPV